MKVDKIRTLAPGSYDDLCSYVREKAGATMAIVIVCGGKHGPGFAVEVVRQRSAELIAEIPELLESLAAEIRAGQLHCKR